MSLARYAFGSVLLAVLARCVLSDLAVVPANEANVEGQNVTLLCSVDNELGFVSWIVHTLDHNQTLVIANGTNVTSYFSERFHVELTDNGTTFNLHISNLSHVDAGVYCCVDNTDSQNASALLTVLVGHPVCNMSAVQPVVQGDSITMSCEIMYNGSLWQRPHMAWYDNAGTLLHNNSWPSTPNIQVTSNLSVTASKPALHTVHCMTYFTHLETSDDEPNNLSTAIPNITFTWTSPFTPVLYGPVNTTIAVAINSTQSVGSYLHCTSQADPAPSYSWSDMDIDSGQQVVGGGEQFMLTRTGFRVINCTATSTIRSQHYTDTAVVELFVTDTGSKGLSASVIGVIVSVCVLLLVAVCVVVYLYCRRRRLHHPYRQMPEDAINRSSQIT